MCSSFKRKDPHHEIHEIPGKPTLVFITLGIEFVTEPWVATPDVHDILRTIWRQTTGWRANYYMLMPEHLHFFAYPGDSDCPLRRWMSYWKRQFTIIHQHQQHRFQTDYWDVTVRSHTHYTERYNYIRLNPVRRGLVTSPEDWPYQGIIHDFTWMEL